MLGVPALLIRMLDCPDAAAQSLLLAPDRVRLFSASHRLVMQARQDFGVDAGVGPTYFERAGAAVQW